MNNNEKESLEEYGFKVSTLQDFLGATDEEMISINSKVDRLFPKVTIFYKVKRALCYWWQRRSHGWDDSETWALDYSVARLILPRLRRFKELNNGYPDGLSEDQWDIILDKLILGFEKVLEDEMSDDSDVWQLWADYAQHLWW